MSISKIAVFGAGVMGSGIAEICAVAGFSVSLYDPSPDAVRRAQKTMDSLWKREIEQKKLSKERELELRSRLQFFGGPMPERMDADLVIEAVTEKLDLKQELFSKLDVLLPPTSILATNTGTLPVTAIAAKTRFPERVCGLHFFNPPVRVPIVEIVKAMQTSSDTVEKCIQFVHELGKETVVCHDSPGFVVSRCQRAFFDEALRCASEGVSDARTMDEIFREGGGFKSGPFETMDATGIDSVYAMSRSIWERSFYDARYRPQRLLKKMTEAGWLGKKSGHGFYEYPNAE